MKKLLLSFLLIIPSLNLHAQKDKSSTPRFKSSELPEWLLDSCTSFRQAKDSDRFILFQNIKHIFPHLVSGTEKSKKEKTNLIMTKGQLIKLLGVPSASKNRELTYVLITGSCKLIFLLNNKEEVLNFLLANCPNN